VDKTKNEGLFIEALAFLQENLERLSKHEIGKKEVENNFQIVLFLLKMLVHFTRNRKKDKNVSISSFHSEINVRFVFDAVLLELQ
jgi:hypothetical protein